MPNPFVAADRSSGITWFLSTASRPASSTSTEVDTPPISNRTGIVVRSASSCRVTVTVTTSRRSRPSVSSRTLGTRTATLPFAGVA